MTIMNNTAKSLPIALSTIVAALLLFVLAVPATAADDGAGEEPELYQKMEMMQDHYRTLGRGLRRPSADDLPDLLEAVQQLELLTVQTKVLIPSKAASIDEADRPAFIQAYRLKQIETLETLLKMETALLTLDFDAASEQWDALKDDKAEGHEEFKAD